MLATPDLVKQARRIEVASRRLVDELLAGQYQSVFKGRGLTFADVRGYAPGDDVRAIDWNVSARMNHPHVKQFVEERDRTINLVLDLSASTTFGSRGRSKRVLAAELAAVIAVSAIRGGDRVGLYLVTDRVERHVPAKKGRRHVLRLVGEILGFEPAGAGTDLAHGLEVFSRTSRGRSVVFLLSDFLGEVTAWDRQLRVVTQRHEVVPIVVVDPLERALPSVGLVQFEDVETGRVVELDTSGEGAADFARLAQARASERDLVLRRAGLEPLEVSTEGDHLGILVGYFRARAKRGRRR
ncbi:MAG: DUF58 domain-containing protein [Kofleriaceae bacterium]